MTGPQINLVRTPILSPKVSDNNILGNLKATIQNAITRRFTSLKDRKSNQNLGLEEKLQKKTSIFKSPDTKQTVKLG